VTCLVRPEKRGGGYSRLWREYYAAAFVRPGVTRRVTPIVPPNPPQAAHYVQPPGRIDGGTICVTRYRVTPSELHADDITFGDPPLAGRLQQFLKVLHG